jgi:protein-S-isoprenylcysteine O-methyltransferase Ste14
MATVSRAQMTDASPPDGRYALVEGLHLRQWAQRAVLPVAVLATNGSGFLDVDWLPRADALGWQPRTVVALRIAGAVLVAISAALRVAAKGVLVRKTTLTTAGVYGVVRHPFYLANLAGAAGTLLLAGPLGAVAAVAWLAAALPLYRVTIAGEESGLARLYPDEFRRYAGAVPALLPRRLRTDAPRARVTWSNLRAEREPPRLARFVAGAAAVAALAFDGPGAVVALCAAAALFACSYLVR